MLQISRCFFTESLALSAVFHRHTASGQLVNPSSCALTPLLCGTGCTGNVRQESWWVQMLLKEPKNSLSLASWGCSSSQDAAGHQGAEGTAQTPKTRGLAVRISQINRGGSFHQPLFSVWGWLAEGLRNHFCNWRGAGGGCVCVCVCVLTPPEIKPVPWLSSILYRAQTRKKGWLTKIDKSLQKASRGGFALHSFRRWLSCAYEYSISNAKEATTESSERNWK